MTYEEVVNRIENYLLSDSTGVVVVDFPSAELHENFVSHFHVGNNKVVSTINYSSQDNLPMLDRIEDELSRNNSKLFLGIYCNFYFWLLFFYYIIYIYLIKVIKRTT